MITFSVEQYYCIYKLLKSLQNNHFYFNFFNSSDIHCIFFDVSAQHKEQKQNKLNWNLNGQATILKQLDTFRSYADLTIKNLWK